MKIFKILYKGLISPYLFVKKYIENSIKDVNVYKYECIDSDNKKEVDYLSINENIINNFLITENKKLVSIKTNKYIKFRFRFLNKKRIKDKELIYFLVHVNKYMNAGNSLINSISLVIKNCKYKNLERILRMVRYDLMCGNDLSTSLLMQKKSFPKLLIDVLNDRSVSEKNHLREMEEYYKYLFFNNTNSMKLNIYKIFIIPYILMISMFIMGYIIPRFYDLYHLYLGEDLIFLKKFIKFSKYDNIMYIVFILIVLIYILFIIISNIKKIKIKLELISMNLMKSIIYKEMFIFFKTMRLVVKYNLSDINILNDNYNNIYFKDVLYKSFNEYREKQVISNIIHNYKYFSKEVVDMIKSGEKFDSLLLQINNVSNFYQSKLDKNKKVTMGIIGPLIIVFSTLLFGSIMIILLLQCLLIIK